MAKIDSLFNFEGTFNGVTHVKSKAYGDHIRAKRGTHTKATVNDAFRQSSKQLLSANTYAKVIKDALDPFRVNFKDGALWPRLVSHFRKQLKDQEAIDFRLLEGMEIFKAHPLDRIGNVITELSINTSALSVEVSLHLKVPPVFKASKYINGYQFTVIGIYVGDDQTTVTSSIVLPVHELHKKAVMHKAALAMPAKVKTILICLKCEGCENGEPAQNPKTKGMKIVMGMNAEPSAEKS
jgi:hypothetical protein